ncbi:START domain, Homeodomain-like, START-like domain protein [Artemisia annua]|uniref:START domain, Homeodomain-like, START-like domain protein n=1 Tax=Artemisia annua TaxID=35608 RepID=A0A2U1PZV2_ARTAN|nr:START domain, Homeodomain-like, START-like domain protein [Artemisia annua]
MEELIRITQIDEPLWVPSPDDTSHETLNEDEYRWSFPRSIRPRPTGLKSEASRSSNVVIMNHMTLVKILMDVSTYVENIETVESARGYGHTHLAEACFVCKKNYYLWRCSRYHLASLEKCFAYPEYITSLNIIKKLSNEKEELNIALLASNGGPVLIALVTCVAAHTFEIKPPTDVLTRVI